MTAEKCQDCGNSDARLSGITQKGREYRCASCHSKNLAELLKKTTEVKS